MSAAGGSGTPDGEIATRFCAGDPSAVATVRGWVRGAVTPYRHSLHAEIEDVEQEVLLSLVTTLREGRFEGRSSLATYVRRMTLYRCINRGRDRRRRPSVAIDDVALESPRPQPEQEAGAREEVRAALRVLARLGEGCRQLWAMVHEGLSYGEMSERLAVAPGTLRVRVLRCRQKAAEEWRRLTGEAR